MTLTFDPRETYIKMVMELSDEKLTQFFSSMGIDIDLKPDTTVYEEEDEGILYDCEA
jgi:hypothetical protein